MRELWRQTMRRDLTEWEMVKIASIWGLISLPVCWIISLIFG